MPDISTVCREPASAVLVSALKSGDQKLFSFTLKEMGALSWRKVMSSSEHAVIMSEVRSAAATAGITRIICLRVICLIVYDFIVSNVTKH